MDIDLVVSTILGFMPQNKCLDLATVSRLFCAKYAPRVTAIDQHTSCNNMTEYFDSGMPATEKVARKAAQVGRLDLFKLAVDRKCSISHQTMELAAKNGHLGIIKSIQNLCTMCTCQGAAMGGQLHVIEFLFPDYAWLPDQIGKMLTRHAVLNGHTSVVTWAHQKGVQLDSALLSTGPRTATSSSSGTSTTIRRARPDWATIPRQ